VNFPHGPSRTIPARNSTPDVRTMATSRGRAASHRGTVPRRRPAITGTVDGTARSRRVNPHRRGAEQGFSGGEHRGRRGARRSGGAPPAARPRHPRRRYRRARERSATPATSPYGGPSGALRHPTRRAHIVRRVHLRVFAPSPFGTGGDRNVTARTLDGEGRLRTPLLAVREFPAAGTCPARRWDHAEDGSSPGWRSYATRCGPAGSSGPPNQAVRRTAPGGILRIQRWRLAAVTGITDAQEVEDEEQSWTTSQSPTLPRSCRPPHR
jgi:hypothetical protein